MAPGSRGYRKSEHQHQSYSPLELLHPTNECHYAVGETFIETDTIDRHLMMFCAEPCVEGKPYCAFHMAIAFRPDEVRRAHDRTVLKGALQDAV